MEEVKGSMDSHDMPIVFYDGECGLCDRFIRTLVKLDSRRQLHFAPLQGQTALEEFGPENADRDEWSIKFTDAQGSYLRSTAALRAIAAAGGVWRLALAFLVVPRFIRDFVYRWVATHRYRWFGRLDSCAIPTGALKERFLP